MNNPLDRSLKPCNSSKSVWKSATCNLKRAYSHSPRNQLIHNIDPPSKLTVFQSFLHQIRSQHKQLLTTLSELHNLSSSFLTHFNRFITQYKKHLKSSLLHKDTYSIPQTSESFYHLQLSELDSFIDSIHRYNLKSSETPEYLKYFVKIIKSQLFQRLFISESYSNTHLLYFNNKSKTLIVYNLENSLSLAIPIEIREEKGWGEALCQLPNGKLLVVGGFNEDFSNSSYLIDLEAKKAEELKIVRRRSWATAALCNSKVYIFGGWNGKYMNESDVYDLNDRVWREISNLNARVSHTSTSVINRLILIAGKPNFLQFYNTKSDFYSLVSKAFNIDHVNKLVVDKDRVLLITRTNVYISAAATLKNWEAHTIELRFDMTTCNPVIKGRSAYFADFRSNLYQFGLDTLEIKKLSV